LAAATDAQEEEDGAGGNGGSGATPSWSLDDFFHILWDGIDGEGGGNGGDGEESNNPYGEELSFCYSKRRCDDNSIFCAALPLQAEAAPQQETCSSSTNDDLEEAWNALLEASSEVASDIQTMMMLISD